MAIFGLFKKGSKDSGDSSPQSLKILIPFYVYPTVWEENNEWKVLAETAAKSKVPIIAIVNPNNGPGDEVIGDYVTGIKMLKDAGIQVIGYIHTQYGERPIDVVKADMKKWETFYQVEGVFIDEVASEHINVDHYKQISEECRSCGSRIIVLNPGISPHKGYFEIAEVVVVFENYAKEWKGQVVGTDNENCCVLVHTCSKADEMKKAIDRIVESKCGYFYVTNDEMPNPWDCLPAYWDEMLDYVNEKVDSGKILDKGSQPAEEGHTQHSEECTAETEAAPQEG